MTPASDTRAQLVDAFAAALAATGYPGLSLTEVAASSGIKKPSLYHHFPGGKEQLYEEAAQRFSRDLGERIGRALAEGAGFEDRLVRLARVAALHANEAISFEQRVYEALDHVAPDIRERVSSVYVASVLAPVVDLFVAAARDGEVSGDPEFLADAFLHLARASGPEGERAAEVVRVFLDGAAPTA